VLSCASS
jgi:hypothetical protein